MHTYLRKNIGWYNKWHEHWAHGDSLGNIHQCGFCGHTAYYLCVERG